MDIVTRTPASFRVTGVKILHRLTVKQGHVTAQKRHRYMVSCMIVHTAILQIQRWMRRQTTVVIQTVGGDPGATRLTVAHAGSSVTLSRALVSVCVYVCVCVCVCVYVRALGYIMRSYIYPKHVAPSYVIY